MKNKVLIDNEISRLTEPFGNSAYASVILITGDVICGMVPDEFCFQLATTNHHVIRCDHHDTGKSTSHEPSETSYSVENLANAVVRVVDDYSLDSAVGSNGKFICTQPF